MLTSTEFWQRITPQQAKSALWYYDRFKAVPRPAVSGFEALLFEGHYIDIPARITKEWMFGYTQRFVDEIDQFREVADGLRR